MSSFEPDKLIESLSARVFPTPPQAAFLFSDAFDPWRGKLFAAADLSRKEHLGDDVFLRGLIEFSSHCARDCDYCGISTHNRLAERYRMDRRQILDSIGAAIELGFRSFVLQSGEDPLFGAGEICALLSEIRGKYDVAVTLSAGEWSREEFAEFRKAGADRYLLRIETSDPVLFARFHRARPRGGGSGSPWENRYRCLQDLRELGFQVGSGILVGLPGQDAESLRRDLEFLIALKPEMVGIGPFIPHPETPLAGEKGGTLESCLTFLSLLRLFMPDAYLPATTAMGTVDPQGRQRALRAGANVLMPNVSPLENRPKYELYPGKICLSDDAAVCRGCVERMVISMGRKVNLGKGHIVRHVY